MVSQQYPWPEESDNIPGKPSSGASLPAGFYVPLKSLHQVAFDLFAKRTGTKPTEKTEGPLGWMYFMLSHSPFYSVFNESTGLTTAARAA